MQAFAGAARKADNTIGLVPTMGSLHEGHLSLMRRAKQECSVLVVSIFVNPTQFGPNEDFSRYPRDMAGDSRKCESAGVDVFFTPSSAEMYPHGSTAFVAVEGISDILEGALRPGHFRGVATVVSKLFNIITPHKAFFGQKDFQQCLVIKRMVAGLNMNVAVVVLPTIREKDGLAMSSRNVYLGDRDRRAALSLHRALSAGETLIKSGERKTEKIKEAMAAVLLNEKGLTIDYIEIADPETLVSGAVIGEKVVLLVAVRVGDTRLIDNLTIP